MGKFIIFVILLFVGVLLGQSLFNISYHFPQNIYYGVTFSPKFASELTLDWKDVYIKILDDLKVRYLRLPTYWDEDLSSVDFVLDEAQKRGVKVILVLGIRQPRWPECHILSGAKSLSVPERQEKVLEFIRMVVQKYKNHPAIFAWQVENEPLLSDFGQGCDKPDRNFLIKEVELVRSLDKRPIILTDSGELGWWVTSMQLSDIFGTTVYRTVYNKIFGFLEYPFLPYFYNVKSTLVRSIFAPSNQKTIIIELQAEPWSPDNNLADTSVEQQTSWFSVDKFKQNLNFGKSTGFDEIYLWGVEWWYFMAQKGYPQYLDHAKTLFAN